MSIEKPPATDLVAEANYFRTQAIRQELETGERLPTMVDHVDRQLPAGVQRTRPAFPQDDSEIDAERSCDKS